MTGPGLSAPPILHRRIRADLEAEIRSGAWPTGFRIPTERDLMARYGCARMTVSRAMASLAQAGLVERRKKAGSFVARPPIRAAVLEIPDIPAVIRARGEAYRFQRLSRRLEAAGAFAVDETGAESTPPVLAVRGLHFASDVPFALERRVINLEAAPQAADLAFDSEPPGTWLLRNVPWTRARHRITAINADAATARRLGVRRDFACLALERWTWGAAWWITFARQIFPADRYDLVASFGP
jgi:GntR family histidine utilization transcriptional repressor